MKLYGAPLLGLLLAALVFAARKYCPFWPSMVFMEAALLFLAGLIAGIRLPDLDLPTPGLVHRSGLTHSCLPALLFWLSNLSPIAGGVALGSALHLSSDLQPKSWVGGALINFPFLGSIGLLSPVWIIANIVGCLAIVMEVVPQESVIAQKIILTICVIGAIWYFLREEKRPLLPLMTLGFATLLVHAVRGDTLPIKLVW